MKLDAGHLLYSQDSVPSPALGSFSNPFARTIMFLGIEIGGTKLQLGVGTGNGPPLIALE